MTEFQLGLLLLFTAFAAGFLCGFILGVVLMKRTLRQLSSRWKLLYAVEDNFCYLGRL
jgi:uncharacterized membrane protein YciS (DUF1049 family)